MPDKILGLLTWYTIREVEVTRKEITQKIEEAGLDPSLAPNPILPVDAFRRATSEMETRRLPQEDGMFVNLLVREVKADRHEVVRHLVRETVDSSNVRLEYEEVAAIRLDKHSGGVGVRHLGAGLTDDEDKALEGARRAYWRYRDAYQGRHLREMVLHALRAMSPVAVRPSGGVYMVPADHEDELGRLAWLVRSLGGEMWTMPVLDGAGSRAVVAQSLAQEVEETAKNLVERLSKALKKSGEASKHEEAHAIGELRRLEALTQRYESILEERLTGARANLEVARWQVLQLLEKAG